MTTRFMLNLKNKIALIAIIIFFGLFGEDTVNGQKLIINHSTSENWPIIDSYAISNDGKFIEYVVTIPSKGSNMYVVASDKSWSKEIYDVSIGSFTTDSRKMIFKNVGDSLGIFDLEAGTIWYIAQVENYSVLDGGQGAYLVYYQRGSPQKLCLLNLNNGEGKYYPGVESYLFNKRGTNLLLIVESPKEGSVMA